MTAEPIWLPDPDQTPRPQIADFIDFANQRTGQSLATYDNLWNWSVSDLDGFWGAVWDFFGVIADEPRHPPQLRRTRSASRPRRQTCRRTGDHHHQRIR